MGRKREWHGKKERDEEDIKGNRINKKRWSSFHCSKQREKERERERERERESNRGRGQGDGWYILTKKKRDKEII